MPSPGTDTRRLNPYFYPLSVCLVGRKAMVVGGGKQAFKEISRLVDFGAFVEVVASNVIPEIDDLCLTYGERVYLSRNNFSENEEKDLSSGSYLVLFAVSESVSENEKAAQAARKAGVLIYSSDRAESSDFLTPSLIKRGHLKIAVSADGLSQALESALTSRIEASLVNEIDKYVLFLSGMREKIANLRDRIQATGSTSDYQAIMRRVSESPEILSALKRQNFEEANQLTQFIIDEELASHGANPNKAGV